MILFGSISMKIQCFLGVSMLAVIDNKRNPHHLPSGIVELNILSDNNGKPMNPNERTCKKIEREK